VNYLDIEADGLAIQEVGRFAKEVLRPVVDQYRDRHIPKETAHELMMKLSEFGIGSGWVPEEHGGTGVSYLMSGLMYEELSKHCPELAGMSFVHEGAAMKILRGGSDVLKNKYLPGLVSGKLIGCSAVTESSGGSNVRGIKTRAKDRGDHYLVSGEKMWISNASIADVILLTARSDDDKFIMLLIDTREVSVEKQEIKKLGLNGWSLGQLNFADVVIPKSNVIGDPAGGLRETMRGFERARCFVSTLALGIAGAALEHSITYVKEREQFGKLLGEHQLIQAMISDMATELHAGRLLVYRALSLLDKGVQCNMEAAMAKVYATEAAVRITSKAIQVHGAFGISTEFPVERLFRAARMLTIPDGTTQINQLVIGRELLGLSAF
jgi:acyl-CoA dehydrogenase